MKNEDLKIQSIEYFLRNVAAVKHLAQVANKLDYTLKSKLAKLAIHLFSYFNLLSLAGLMGRGLGGMKERAQNENLMQGKFAEKLSDEHDAELEDRNLRRM